MHVCSQRLPFIGLVKLQIDLSLVHIIKIMTMIEILITIREEEAGEDIIKVEEIEATTSRMTVLNLVHHIGTRPLSRMYKTM